jgi:hypothetical protein
VGCGERALGTPPSRNETIFIDVLPTGPPLVIAGATVVTMNPACDIVRAVVAVAADGTSAGLLPPVLPRPRPRGSDRECGARHAGRSRHPRPLPLRAERRPVRHPGLRRPTDDVRTVLVGGRVVVDEGRLLTLDEDAVRTEVVAARDALLARAGFDRLGQWCVDVD